MKYPGYSGYGSPIACTNTRGGKRILNLALSRIIGRGGGVILALNEDSEGKRNGGDLPLDKAVFPHYYIISYIRGDWSGRELPCKGEKLLWAIEDI